MCFDVYSMPMKVEEPDIRIAYTQDDVFNFLRSVEREFSLPYFTMTRKSEHGRANRLHGNEQLSEIRVAVVMYILEKTTINPFQLAKGMRLNHASVFRARVQGDSRFHTLDEKFLTYYNRIKQIPLLCIHC